MPLDAAALRILGEQLRDPSTADKEIEVDGNTWYVRRAPRPGVEMAIAVGGAASGPMITMYEAVPGTPEGYPGDVPFVPDTRATVMRDPASVMTSMVMWTTVADAAVLVRELEAASIAEGWSITERGEAFGTVALELERGGFIRVLTAASMGPSQMVTLAQGVGRDRSRGVT